jgi:hypothetical protein
MRERTWSGGLDDEVDADDCQQTSLGGEKVRQFEMEHHLVSPNAKDPFQKDSWQCRGLICVLVRALLRTCQHQCQHQCQRRRMMLRLVRCQCLPCPRGTAWRMSCSTCMQTLQHLHPQSRPFGAQNRRRSKGRLSDDSL